jgi:uncharacterized protein YkwD
MARLESRARAGKRPFGVLIVVLVAMATTGLVYAFSASATPAPVRERRTTNDEYALLVLTNEARVQNHLTPLRWSTDLAKAAQSHTWDMITNNCFSHDSCPGSPDPKRWDARVGKYYPGWVALGENIAASLSNPQNLHDGWMASDGHRANILNSNVSDFGTAIMCCGSAFSVAYSTEDFGSRGLLQQSLLYGMPAAAVLKPPTGDSTQWQLAANFIDSAAPTDVHAVVDGKVVPLRRTIGTDANGTYTATFSSDRSACKKVYFEATRSNGTVSRWPREANTAIGLGDNESNCWNVWQTVSGGGATTTTTPTTEPTSTTSTTVGATTTTTVPRTNGDTPVVTIESPGASIVRKAVTIRANARDNTKVAAMEVWVDGKRLLRKAGNTITRQWMANASSVKAGEHTITVKAFDDEGNVGTQTVTVTK